MTTNRQYWVTTGLVAALLLLSAGSYLIHPGTIQGLAALGFPDFFRLQLAVLKLLAVVALVAPRVPAVAKEWAYAGVGLFLVTAIVAHTAHGDPWALTVANLAFFALLVSSHRARHRRGDGIDPQPCAALSKVPRGNNRTS